MGKGREDSVAQVAAGSVLDAEDNEGVVAGEFILV